MYHEKLDLILDFDLIFSSVCLIFRKLVEKSVYAGLVKLADTFDHVNFYLDEIIKNRSKINPMRSSEATSQPLNIHLSLPKPPKIVLIYNINSFIQSISYN